MKLKLLFLFGAVGALALLFAFWRVDEDANATTKRTFVLDVDFDKFRQILVRTDATASIIEHSGMKLTRNSVDTVEIDLTNDSRPIRSAIAGKSKAEVAAGKRLTVQLSDPQLDADELFLYQDAQIQPDEIHVRTESIEPAGKLRSYVTTLDAVRDKQNTLVTLSVGLSIDLHISPFVLRFARSRVRNAASSALEEQEIAIRKVVSQFADKKLFLPTLGSMQPNF